MPKGNSAAAVDMDGDFFNCGILMVGELDGPGGRIPESKAT